MADPLSELPVKNGFRMRGLGTTRLETFTDAAFAFALTLLVLSTDIPSSYHELIATLGEIPAFVLSATLLMMFWVGHHTWSRRFGLEDGPTIVLSCVLVFTVLVYVYPLRFMFSSMTARFAYLLGFGGSAKTGGLLLGEVNRLFTIYGAGFTAMCGAIVLLNVYAWRKREVLELNVIERFETRTEILAWSIVGSAGVLSVLLATLTPPTTLGLPGWVYSLLAIVMPIFGRRVDRRRRKLLAQSSP